MMTNPIPRWLASPLRSLASPLIAVGVFLLAACERPPEPIPIDADEHRASVAAFAAARASELQAPDSWLSLIGLHWLDEGETTLGADSAMDITLPPDRAPARVGRLIRRGATVRFVAEPGVLVTQGVDSTLNLPAGSGAVAFDASGDPLVREADLTADVGAGKFVVLRLGDLNWIVIRREEQVALRLRDNAGGAYANWDGIDRYPTSPEWRVTARWVAHDKTVAVPNVLGTVSESPSPAALEFWIDGARHTLDVVGEPDHGRYMLVFADATSGAETYGGGRYLWVDQPDERGRVVVDFNLAYDPPCVWTAFATCPLPTRDNRLTIAVTAGERGAGH
ncbi:MAG TPA: DUF1684 domain-containing protein [Longimicrobiales bacterium]